MDTTADLPERVDEERRTAWAAGRVLHGWRVRRELSQQELADLLGWNKKTIQRFERGERQMSFAQILSLCRALKVDAREFVAGVEAEMAYRVEREVGGE